jgi:GMP synthase-like glutamine amidotransferase
MSVLICKNTETEGPETIGDFLTEKGMDFSVVDLSKGDSVPNSADFDFLVMMGGPMSVNEDDIYPYINLEERLVRDFTEKGKGVLGVCLGAQIMAKALGARVYKGAEKEIGWHDIELTREGLNDPFMSKLAISPDGGALLHKFKVFQWHGETFNIPEGAVRLAQSRIYPNQAFKFGQNAYAFQFHIEVRKDTIARWLKDEPVDMAQINAETNAIYDEYHSRAYNFYNAFLKNQS